MWVIFCRKRTENVGFRLNITARLVLMQPSSSGPFLAHISVECWHLGGPHLLTQYWQWPTALPLVWREHLWARRTEGQLIQPTCGPVHLTITDATEILGHICQKGLMFVQCNFGPLGHWAAVHFAWPRYKLAELHCCIKWATSHSFLCTVDHSEQKLCWLW